MALPSRKSSTGGYKRASHAARVQADRHDQELELEQLYLAFAQSSQLTIRQVQILGIDYRTPGSAPGRLIRPLDFSTKLQNKSGSSRWFHPCKRFKCLG